jgi:hypothetical protein
MGIFQHGFMASSSRTILDYWYFIPAWSGRGVEVKNGWNGKVHSES